MVDAVKCIQGGGVYGEVTGKNCNGFGLQSSSTQRLGKNPQYIATVPGARNPFVVSQRNEASSGSASGNPRVHLVAQAKHK